MTGCISNDVFHDKGYFFVDANCVLYDDGDDAVMIITFM